MEPHYRLPFLSWLPHRAADRYVALSGRADHYHEPFRTRPGLRQLCRGLRVWDYTYTVLAEPGRFQADDMVPARLQSAPPALWKALTPIIPTFIWVGTPGTAAPRRAPCARPVLLPPSTAVIVPDRFLPLPPSRWRPLVSYAYRARCLVAGVGPWRPGRRARGRVAESSCRASCSRSCSAS